MSKYQEKHYHEYIPDHDHKCFVCQKYFTVELEDCEIFSSPNKIDTTVYYVIYCPYCGRKNYLVV